MGGPGQRLFPRFDNALEKLRDGRGQNHGGGVLNHCTTTSCSNRRQQIASRVSQANGTPQYTATPGRTQNAAISKIVAAVHPNNPTATTTTTSPAKIVNFKGQVTSEIGSDGKIKATIKLPEGYSHGQFRFNTNDSIKSEGSWLGLSGKSSTSSEYTKVSMKNLGDRTLQVELGKERNLVEIQVRDDEGNVSTIKLSREDIQPDQTQPNQLQPALPPPNQPQLQPQPNTTPPTPSAGPSTGPTSRDIIIADDAKKLVDAIKTEQTQFDLSSQHGGHGANGLPVAIKQLANREEANRILNSYDSLHLRGELIRAGGDNLVNLVKNSPLQDTLLDMLLETKDKNRVEIQNHVKEFSGSQSSGLFASNKEKLAAISDLLMTTPGLATAMGLEWETNYRGSFRKTESLLGQLNWELGITGEKDLGKFETSAIKAWERRVLSGK
jgi:hypothetical protein